MSDISVEFIHPRDGRLIAVTLDNTITANEAISELLAANFIDVSNDGYGLVLTSGQMVGGGQTLADAGVKQGDKIRVYPATSAGGGKVRGSGGNIASKGIPGLDKKSVKNFPAEDIRNSPQAFTMIIRLYDELQNKYESLSSDLEREKFRSRDRFVAALLLLVSQVVLSIAGNLLTSNRAIAIPVFIVGGLQAALALYLTFRNPDSDR